MIQRHNKLCDFTAYLLTEVCHNVAMLQPLDGETFHFRSANINSEVRLDVRAHRFCRWNHSQDAHFN